MLKRFSVLTMESKVVCRIIETKQDDYKRLGIMPWHHIVIDNGLAYIYIWDSRKIDAVISENCLDQEDLTYAVLDNRMDLICNLQESKSDVIEKCLEHKEDMPILFIDGELTEHEKELLMPIHY